MSMLEVFVCRAQRGHGKSLVDEPVVAMPTEQERRPARVAVMLALAHKIQEAIDRGVVQDQAEAARRLGVSRARLTQLLDLTLLAPGIQEELLFLEAVGGVEGVSERAVRPVVKHERWEEQRLEWTRIKR